MSEHTPGPWGVFDGVVGGTDARKVFVQPTDAEREFSDIVAEMPMMSHPKDVQLANARLIAAAPDLYVAANGLLRILTEKGELGTGFANGDWIKAIAALTAAVQKATGAGTP